MTVIIINPNSTASMTDAMVEVAQRSVPSLEFQGWTSRQGPPSIQGADDGDAATPPLLELVKEASDAKAEGIIIGCFDDTALTEAAALADCPVIGLGQSAYHYAALQTWRFSVVTTLSVSVPILEANIHRMGLGAFVSKVRASDVPVLDLEIDPERSGALVVKEALQAQANDDVSAVILGCAGMVGVVESVERALDIRTIDPVACAARCMAWLV